MNINLDSIHETLLAWSNAETQSDAVIQITRAYFEHGMTFPLLHRIELADGSLNHSALFRNTQNLFQRWIWCNTPDKKRKIEALWPAIYSALPIALKDSLISNQSIEYLATRLLKENQETITAALLRATPDEFNRECDELEQALNGLRTAYADQYRDMTNDQT